MKLCLSCRWWKLRGRRVREKHGSLGRGNWQCALYADPAGAAPDWTGVSSESEDAPPARESTLLGHRVQLDATAQGPVLALPLKETFALGLFLSLSPSLCELAL